MATDRRSVLTARALLALLLAVAIVAITSVAAAADDHPAPPKLGIAPLGTEGAWFELELAASETANVSVELANHGDDALDVATYPADVYTLINGGMGVRLRGEPIAATAAWLEYRADTVRLRPDGAVARTVTVTVPDQTQPGQYIAALVVENDQPLPAEGSVSLDRVVRQAIAVNVTVPGPARPALTLGGADHHETGGRSVVELEIDNPGNRHLKPEGELTLTDATGTTVASHQVTMDSFYAGTDTHLELSLDERLEAGTYTLNAHLVDTDHGIDVTGDATFEVLPPADRPNPVERAISEAIDLTADRAVWLPAALLAATLAGLVLTLRRRRRRRRRRRAPAPRPEPSAAAPAATPARVTAYVRPPDPTFLPPPPPAPRPTTPVPPAATFLPPPPRSAPGPTMASPAPAQPAIPPPPRPPAPAPGDRRQPVPAMSGAARTVPQPIPVAAARTPAPVTASARGGDIDPSFFTARPAPGRRKRARLRG